jgi:lysophospholipase L1-like esterase
MRFTLVACILLISAVSATTSAPAQKERNQKANRWEAAIQAFEKQDELEPPPMHAVVFVGSSSIRKWDLKKSFPELAAINRGFGGSEVSDSIQFADRLILKHKPRMVVIYAGDNDIARGKSPERVRDDFKELVAKIHKQLPEAKIVYFAIKPSIRRWNLVDKMRAANRMIRKITEDHELLEFVDVDKPMIGDDGMPRPDLFVKDGLHLSTEGYKLWASLLKPHL